MRKINIRWALLQRTAAQRMAQQSARVAQECEAAKDSLELILDNCDLRKFPEAVFFLMKDVQLKVVNLSHNQLQRLPPKLGSKFMSICGK